MSTKHAPSPGRICRSGCWSGYVRAAETPNSMYGSCGYKSTKRSVRFVRRAP